MVTCENKLPLSLTPACRTFSVFLSLSLSASFSRSLSLSLAFTRGILITPQLQCLLTCTVSFDILFFLLPYVVINTPSPAFTHIAPLSTVTKHDMVAQINTEGLSIMG